jgi:hypothetical protein
MPKGKPPVGIQSRRLIAALLTTISLVLFSCGPTKQITNKLPLVVYQPSHQSDTGTNYNEALVCNNIVDAAMAASTGVVRVHKVWSYNQENLHHARQGSNTKIDHSTAVDSLGRISGYAYEITESNKLKPDVFVAVHNNGASKRNACWGFVHEEDEYEQQNRGLAGELVAEICMVSGMDNAGVLGDSWPNRNDYRCKNTGKLSFYSLDENTNKCPIRVLLEIGDNKASYELLMNPAVQKKIGEAIQRVIEKRFGKESR